MGVSNRMFLRALSSWSIRSWWGRLGWWSGVGSWCWALGWMGANLGDQGLVGVMWFSLRVPNLSSTWLNLSFNWVNCSVIIFMMISRLGSMDIGVWVWVCIGLKGVPDLVVMQYKAKMVQPILEFARPRSQIRVIRPCINQDFKYSFNWSGKKVGLQEAPLAFVRS